MASFVSNGVMARGILTVLLLLAAPKLASPPKDAILAYAGPLWQAWRYPDKKRANTLTVRLHTGKLERQVTLPKGHAFLLMLGDGSVVTTPRQRKYVTLLKPDGKRVDHAPYVWKSATRLVEAYRDGIVVQTERKGTGNRLSGHLFFIPWDRGELKRDGRIRLTKEELLVEPRPKVRRQGRDLYFEGEKFNLSTKQREEFEENDATDLRIAFLERDGLLYFVRATQTGVELSVRDRKRPTARTLGDFRVPERELGDTAHGTNCYSFKPRLRGWRHVRWDRDGLVYWNGKAWTRVAWAKR